MELFTLTPENIDIISEKAGEYLLSHGVSKRDKMSVELAIGEALLKYRDEFGDGISVTYREGFLFGQVRIFLSVDSNSFNPFLIRENPGDFIMDSLVNGDSATSCSWKYKNLLNELTFTANREIKLSLIVKICIGIGAGLVFGLLGRLIPNGFAEMLSNDYLRPIANAYVSLLCVMAVIATFTGVILGIVHSGDMSAANNIGKRMIGRFFISLGITVIACSAILIPFSTFGSTDALSLNFKTIFDLLIDIVPSNPIVPLINFNSAQMIVVGAMIGFTMLYLGQKAAAVQDVLEQSLSISVVVNSFINSAMVHIYVGVNVFILVTASDLSEIAGTLKIIGVILISYLVIFIGYTIYTSLTVKCNPFKLIRALMPVFVINISSASFSASFQSSYETLLDNGVSCDYLNLGLNIGGLLFKPAHALLFVVSTTMFASSAGITVSLEWLLTLAILSILLSASLPCIPGASISGFAIIFPQLGIPTEYLTLAITMNAIVDLFTVAVDVYCLQNENIIGSSHMKMLDRSSLLKN